MCVRSGAVLYGSFFGSLWHQREVFTIHGRDGSEVGRSL